MSIPLACRDSGVYWILESKDPFGMQRTQVLMDKRLKVLLGTREKKYLWILMSKDIK